MQGFPRYLATREDVQNCLELYPEQTRDRLRDLIDSRFIWTTTGTLAEGDEGITDDTHRVITEETSPGETSRYQQELQEDPNCHLFRLGLSVEEAEGMIG